MERLDEQGAEQMGVVACHVDVLAVDRRPADPYRLGDLVDPGSVVAPLVEESGGRACNLLLAVAGSSARGRRMVAASASSAPQLTLRSTPAQYRSRNSRLSTFPAPDTGSASTKSVLRGAL
jgi:hypothetical protein